MSGFICKEILPTSSPETIPTNSTNDQEKAETLNKFFEKVFTVEDVKSVPNLNNRSDGNCVTDLEISESDVLKILENLNINKACGPDFLHPRLLKELKSVIYEPLTIIFRQSFEEEQLPLDWKTANVKALYKKGDRSDPGNYRPVSLTCVPCKIMEKIVRNHIVGHMNQHSLFSASQYGFMSLRSCALQLLEVMEQWTSWLDEDKDFDCVYFDFRKAFDTVPHARLLEKMKSYGIEGNDVCLECLFPDNCFPNNTCRPGTTGSFCEKCDSDFYRIGSVCLQCPTIPWPAVCFSVYIAIFLASCFFYGFKESVCTKTKLLLHYLQLMLLTLHVKIAWPQLLAQMISALSFGVFNSNILIPGCVLGSFETMTIHYLEWYTSLCIPVVVYIIWYLLDKSLKVIIDRHGREMQKSSEKRRNKMGQRLKLRRFVWLVAVVMYMPALVSSMRTFQCSGTISKDMVFDEKKELFLLDTNHSCRTFTFQLIHSVAVVYVIFIILGTFLLLFFMLRQRKWKLLEKGWMLYSPIYESYKSKYCFWEAVPMLRKLACIMVTESHPVSHIYESYKSKYCFWEAVPMFRKLASIMVTESHPVSHISVYESNKSKYCFWEAVPMFRKLACIIVTESHPIRPLWQVTVQLALTLAYLLLVMVFWPYRACFWKYKNLNNHIAFEILSNISVLLLQVVGLAVVMGRYREEYAYIQILSVVAVLLVWLVQMASIKCEFETETDVEEIDNTEISDTDEIRTSYHRQKYCNCLTWWKKNRVEPGPHKQKKVKERQQNIDF